MRRSLAVLVIAAGCGGGDPNGDDDGAVVDAGGVDSGGGVDAPPGCNATVTFEPDQPFVGTMVEAFGDISGGEGVIAWNWTVKKNGTDVPFTRLADDFQDIKFLVEEAGIYDVSLEVGGGCAPFFGGLNVSALGANNRAVRLRFVPPSSVSAPPQERTIVVSGGADYAAGILSLDRGDVFPVVVRTPALAPVAGYLRFTSRATPDAVVEGFSDAAGNAAVRLIAGRYDVLVVPTSSALAPRTILNWDPSLQQPLTVDAGLTLAGTVLDAAGAPVAGARVSLVSSGVPSTIATTAADGTFALQWREGGGAEQVTVVPPDGSDLPRLDAAVEITGIAALTVQHAAVPSSDVGGTLVRVGGVAAASTDVLVSLSRPASGTFRDGSIVLAAATGSHRRVLATDATGRLPAARLVDGSGGAFITSTTGGPGAIASLTLPLGGTIDAAAPVTVTGQVQRAAGGPRAGARIRATLEGPLAHTGAPAPTVVAGNDGRFALVLAAGAPYTLELSDPSHDDAALSVVLPAAAAQELSSLVLPAALAITGEVRATGSSVGARAVGIAALCHLECAGVARSRPLGEAVSDLGGRFVLTVPDPGVQP